MWHHDDILHNFHFELLTYWRFDIMPQWLSNILRTFWTTFIFIPKLKSRILTYNMLSTRTHPVPKTLKWRIIIVDTFSARAAPEWKSVSYHVEHDYLLVEVCVINKCYCLFWCGGMGLTNVPVFFWVEVGVFNKCDCLLWCGSIDLTNVHDFYGWIHIADLA